MRLPGTGRGSSVTGDKGERAGKPPPPILAPLEKTDLSTNYVELTPGEEEVGLLFWPPRRHAKIETKPKPQALIRDLRRSPAYSEACRREHDASSHAIARDWGSVALVVARLIARAPDVDPLVRLATNAVPVSNREDAAPRSCRSLSLDDAAQAPIPSQLTPEAESTRVTAPTTHTFRIPIVGAAPDRGPAASREVEIWDRMCRQLSSPPRISRGLLER